MILVYRSAETANVLNKTSESGAHYLLNFRNLRKPEFSEDTQFKLVPALITSQRCRDAAKY